MSKYKEIIKIIEENDFKIVSEKCYDAQSGWTGEDLWVMDGHVKVTNLSSNGYCFNETVVDRSFNDIHKYISMRNMETFEDFKRWVNANKEEKK